MYRIILVPCYYQLPQMILKTCKYFRRLYYFLLFNCLLFFPKFLIWRDNRDPERASIKMVRFYVVDILYIYIFFCKNVHFVTLIDKLPLETRNLFPLFAGKTPKAEEKCPNKNERKWEISRAPFPTAVMRSLKYPPPFDEGFAR